MTSIDELSERLADVFRTGDAGDVFTDDVFLDGNPPYWRFQLQGLDAFRSWLRGYAPEGHTVEVVRTIATETGFVTEQTSSATRDGSVITGRDLYLCELRDGRIAEMTVYCSGEWDEELRARHAAEAPMLRP
jgi:hypothetical protein